MRKRPVMNNILAVSMNNTTLAAFPHVIAGALLTAGTFDAAIGNFWMARNSLRAKQIRASKVARVSGGTETPEVLNPRPAFSQSAAAK